MPSIGQNLQPFTVAAGQSSPVVKSCNGSATGPPIVKTVTMLTAHGLDLISPYIYFSIGGTVALRSPSQFL